MHGKSKDFGFSKNANEELNSKFGSKINICKKLQKFYLDIWLDYLL